MWNNLRNAQTNSKLAIIFIVYVTLGTISLLLFGIHWQDDVTAKGINPQIQVESASYDNVIIANTLSNFPPVDMLTFTNASEAKLVATSINEVTVSATTCQIILDGVVLSSTDPSTNASSQNLTVTDSAVSPGSHMLETVCTTNAGTDDFSDFGSLSAVITEGL